MRTTFGHQRELGLPRLDGGVAVGELVDMVPGRVLAENGELCATALLALTPIGYKGCDNGTDADVDKPGGPT